jgi:hypothetical protein
VVGWFVGACACAVIKVIAFAILKEAYQNELRKFTIKFCLFSLCVCVFAIPKKKMRMVFVCLKLLLSFPFWGYRDTTETGVILLDITEEEEVMEEASMEVEVDEVVVMVIMEVVGVMVGVVIMVVVVEEEEEVLFFIIAVLIIKTSCCLETICSKLMYWSFLFLNLNLFVGSFLFFNSKCIRSAWWWRWWWT